MSNTYTSARDHIGLYDQSTKTGRLIGRGKDAIDLLHRMSTNDLKPVEQQPLSGAQTVLTNEKGRIIDLITVLNRGTDSLILTSKDHEENIIKWLDKFTIMDDARFERATEAIAQFLLIGRGAYGMIRDLIGVDPSSIARFHAVNIEIAGVTVLVQKSVRIAESGWTILVDQANAVAVFDALQAQVLELGGAILDDETYDVLRIETGIPAAPNEMNEKHNPLEAALVTAVSFTKGCYIGQEVIARLDSYDKVQRHLLGVRLTENPSSELPLQLFSKEGEAIGEVTSLAFSPGIEAFIGLAYIKSAYSNPGAQYYVKSEKGDITATLEKLPFELELV